MTMKGPLWRIDAAGAADAAGCSFAPASLLFEHREPSRPWEGSIVAVGHPAEISTVEIPASRRLTFPASVILPALANAHTHLDLTHIGPRPYEALSGFVGWAMSTVRANRAQTLEAARASLRAGIDLSLAGGVVAVGDILGALPGYRPTPNEPDPRALLAADLRATFGDLAVPFAEVFGMGANQPRAIEELNRLAAAGCALQPHAPYTAGRRVYAHAARLAPSTRAPFCTHLAETLDERRFTQHGDGAFRDLLERIGVWDDHAAAEVGRGLHPIEHVLDALGPQRHPFLAAHVNDCPDSLLERVAAARICVAYCPRAHEYFLHPATTGPHSYRRMLDAGINVCLGTDSIINLPPDQSDRLSTLDEMRLLFHRDATPAGTLLAMGTTHSARALGLSESLFTLALGPTAGLIAVDVTGTMQSAAPLDRAMHSRATPHLLRWDTPEFAFAGGAR